MTADPRHPSIVELADAAGLDAHWIDASGFARRVGDDMLAALLDALGYPCGTRAARAESAARLAAHAQAAPRLVTGDVDAPLTLPASLGRPGACYRVTLENGDAVAGRFAQPAGAAVLPPLATPGYHVLDTGEQRTTLAIAPPSAWTPADAMRAAAAGGRDRPPPWGLAAQLYGLRREADGGIGDFTALAACARAAARRGAHALAISPTQAAFPALPERDSPYSPSSRLWRNAAYIDVEMVLGAHAARAAIADAGLAAQWSALTRAPLVDWPGAVPAKLRVLRLLFDRWRARAPTGADAGPRAFARFRARHAGALDAHATFDALQACCIDNGIGADWRRWPPAWRTPDAPDVAAFARAHAHDIAFHAFLQWQAARGLAAAQRAARGRGMAIGLIADLPVGCDAAGSDAWRDGDAMLRGLSIGAPADPFNARGQAWGVTTWTPTALRARGFAPFVECLRAGFAHAGGVRIDHVLGLARLWVVRDGAPPRDGAYLRYPRDDLLRLAALESFRHRAIVIGEDLGTVPADFRARIAARGIVGLRALWFERDPAGAFRAPGDWDRHAAATSSTHDLPTVAGWWRGVDLGWRWRAAASASACAPASSLSPASDAEAEANAPPARPGESEVAGPDALPPEVRDMRRAERAALWRALQQAGVAARGQKMPPRDAPPVGAILAYVAQAPAPLAIFPLEDLLALEGQPNVPGPPCGHPNWRRRMPRSVDALFDAPARTRIAAVRRARKRAR